LSRFRTTVSVGNEVTLVGRLFQRRLPAALEVLYVIALYKSTFTYLLTRNTWSPTVKSCVRRITSCEDVDDRWQRRLESATCWM